MPTHEVTRSTEKNENIIKNYVVEHPIFSHETYPIAVSLDPSWNNEFGILTYKKYEEVRPFEGENYQRMYRKNVLWDFGDGTTVMGFTAEHYYKIPGKYNITCTFFDVNRLGVKNGYEISVIVKQVIPSALTFDINQSSEEQIKCSTISKLAHVETTLSNNVSNEVPVIAKRLYQDGEEFEDSWDDVKNDPYPHLRKYWTFLKGEFEYYENSQVVFTERYVPTKEYMPEYEDLYGYFTLLPSNEIAFRCYRIQAYNNIPKMPDIKINDPNKNITEKEYFINVPVWDVSSLTELPRFAKHIGKRAFIDVLYKSDFLSEKTIISLALDVDNMNIANSIESAPNFLNIPPLGLHFSVVENSVEDMFFSLTLNGFVTSYEPVDKLVQLSLVQNYTFPCIIVPYIMSEYNGYYIPKDLDFSATQVEIIEGIYNDSVAHYRQSENTIPFLRFLELECNSTLNLTLRMKDYIFGIELNYPLKDFDNLIIPTEKFYNQNVPRLIDAYTPHRMFEKTPLLKKALIDFFDNDKFLDYIVTKGIHFFDDTTNIKSNYISFLIQTLQMMNVDAYEYDQTLLDGVNELRDFVRILSMNHTDLMGNYVNENYDIKFRPLYKGKHIGDNILVTDRIYLDRENKVIKFMRDGKVYFVLDPNEYIVTVDNYTYQSKMVNFLGWFLTEAELKALAEQLESEPLSHLACMIERGINSSPSGKLSSVDVSGTCLDMSSADLQYPLYLALWEEKNGTWEKYAVSNNPCRLQYDPDKSIVWSFENQGIDPHGKNLQVRWLVDPMDSWDIEHEKYIQDSICIGTWYNPRRNWGLLLPDNTYDNPEDTAKIIESYYSFYLLHPNSDMVYINNFLDENTITDEMRDKDKWADVYGCTFDVLEKIIFDAIQLRDNH